MRWPMLALFAVGCSFSGGGNQGDAPDAGEVLPDAPEGSCDPTEAPECPTSTTLRACAEDGSGYVDTDCPLGCIDSPAAHCGEFTPSNNADFGDSEADTSVDDTWVFNTDTGEITLLDATVIRAAGSGLDVDTGIGFTTVDQSGPRDIGVFEFRTLTVEEGQVLVARGTAVLGLVASGDITVNGLIDVSASPDACNLGTRRCAGPGGGNGGNVALNGSSPMGNMGRGEGGDDGGGDLTDGETGGGGGGFGTDGGDSGTADNVNPAAGGVAWAPTDLSPISGGAGGGGGATEPNNIMGCGGSEPYLGGLGGGAGGAVQIASAASVSFAQIAGGSACGVDAGGAGGGPGGCSAAGGGGGSGGGVLIEAASITVADACVLAANGGAGGAANNEAQDAPGQDGLLAATAATGGGAGGAQGGNGAARDVAATASGDVSTETGGGGGGAGVIVLRSLAGGVTLANDPSPTESVGTLTVF